MTERDRLTVGGVDPVRGNQNRLTHDRHFATSRAVGKPTRSIEVTRDDGAAPKPAAVG